jgi:hypothetical protein
LKGAIVGAYNVALVVQDALRIGLGLAGAASTLCGCLLFCGRVQSARWPALIGNRPLGVRTQSTRRKRMRLEVRRANLDDDLRDLFEQYGEQVVAMALALGSNQGTGLRTHPVAPTHAMSVVHANQDAAARWLLERRDLAERRETIGMIINAALLVFIALSILLGVINMFRGLH